MLKQDVSRLYFKFTKTKNVPLVLGVEHKLFFLFFFNNFLKKRRFFRNVYRPFVYRINEVKRKFYTKR